ncbi:hypothetical protein cypCar_00034729 [Cyprinus carpio]|nr:hypothetical protein cypCar_00034729 [Cyprinus carpio]
MSARVCCSVSVLLLCLSGCLTTTDAAPGRNCTVLGHCPAKLTVVPSSRGCVSDKDCSGGHKCCVFDCGAVCVPPAFMKPGRCALPKGTPMCAEYCYHDGQCPAEQKCCPTTCGHACSEPC